MFSMHTNPGPFKWIPIPTLDAFDLASIVCVQVRWPMPGSPFVAPGVDDWFSVQTADWWMDRCLFLYLMIRTMEKQAQGIQPD